MNPKTPTNQKRFERVLLGLPYSVWAPVATHWQVTGNLARLGINAVEIHFFHTLLPEMLSTYPYIAVIHSDLLDLKDTANCDRAILIKIAELLPQSLYVVWNHSLAWEPTETPLPRNLEVWSNVQTSEVTQRILNLLGNLVHLNGRPDRKSGRS